MPRRHSEPPEFLTRPAYGLPATDVFAAVLTEPVVSALMERILTATYSRFFGQPGTDFVSTCFGRLRALTRDPTPAVIQETFLELRKDVQAAGIRERYSSEFRDRNLRSSLELVGTDTFRGRVLDIGADDNRLGGVLLKLVPEVQQVIGLDIERRSPVAAPPELEFRLQPSPCSIPVEDGSADAAVCRYSLHHMERSVQPLLVTEMSRTLCADGCLVIFENSFSLSMEPSLGDSKGFHSEMLALGPARIYTLLAGLDTFSFAIKDKRMEFHHSFREVEDWIQLFRRSRLELLEMRYLGIPVLDLHQAPCALFILRKRAAEC